MKKFLLDTHTLIWFSNADKQLSSKAKKAIENYPQSKSYVSIATFWEMAIKVNTGKLKLNFPMDDYKLKLLENKIEILPVTFEHTLLVSSLPFHHRDPFDRLIIVQSIAENLTIITNDNDFKLYDNIRLLW